MRAAVPLHVASEPDSEGVRGSRGVAEPDAQTPILHVRVSEVAEPKQGGRPLVRRSERQNGSVGSGQPDGGVRKAGDRALVTTEEELPDRDVGVDGERLPVGHRRDGDIVRPARPRGRVGGVGQILPVPRIRPVPAPGVLLREEDATVSDGLRQTDREAHRFIADDVVQQGIVLERGDGDEAGLEGPDRPAVLEKLERPHAQERVVVATRRKSGKNELVPDMHRD